MPSKPNTIARVVLAGCWALTLSLSRAQQPVPVNEKHTGNEKLNARQVEQIHEQFLMLRAQVQRSLTIVTDPKKGTAEKEEALAGIIRMFVPEALCVSVNTDAGVEKEAIYPLRIYLRMLVNRGRLYQAIESYTLVLVPEQNTSGPLSATYYERYSGLEDGRLPRSKTRKRITGPLPALETDAGSSPYLVRLGAMRVIEKGQPKKR